VHDRFIQTVQRVMVLAGEEARSLGQNYVGTGHLLLGLLSERGGVVVRVLEALNVAPDRVRDRVREQVICTVGSDQAGTEYHQRPSTPRARGALELASKEALSFGHDYVGTEHVLLGLVCEFGSVAAQVLYRLGADADGIRREVTRMLSDGRETVIRDPKHVAGLAHTTLCSGHA
jgi:ATP-dependent Clp protease ATP-binding subunit ClpC